MKGPEVSILMPVFNAAPFVAEAIESVLAQEAAPTWELLVVDDGSRDDSVEQIERYARREHGRIRVLRHAGGGNRGSSASRNLALAHAAAPLVALLDADDAWLAGAMSAQTRVLERYPEAVMAYAAAERWHRHRHAGPSAPPDFTPRIAPAGEAAGLLDPPTLVDWFWNDESLAPCTCTVFARTRAVRGVGAFEDQFSGLYDDQVLYVKLALSGPVFASPRCIARYRQHERSCCHTSSARQVEARAAFERWVLDYRRSKVRSASATPPQAPSRPAR